MTPFGGTPIARYILIDPGIQFKSVEGNSLFSDRYSCDKRPDFGVEAVAVHAQIS
jgi:hypothetical protein